MNRIDFVELAKDGMEVHSSMPDGPEYVICQELLRLAAENEALKRPNNVVGIPQNKLIELQTIIRQQQAEIEKLKAEIDRLVNHSRTWTPFD